MLGAQTMIVGTAAQIGDRDGKGAGSVRDTWGSGGKLDAAPTALWRDLAGPFRQVGKTHAWEPHRIALPEN